MGSTPSPDRAMFLLASLLWLDGEAPACPRHKGRSQLRGWSCQLVAGPRTHLVFFAGPLAARLGRGAHERVTV